MGFYDIILYVVLILNKNPRGKQAIDVFYSYKEDMAV